MRDLTASVESELSEACVRPLLLALLEFPSGPMRMWTGVGPLLYAGEVYTGGGQFIGISPIRESQNFEASGIELSLNGIPSDLVALALEERCKGRPVTISLGFLNDSGAVIDSPIALFKGQMDTITIKEGPELSSIMVTAESRAALLKRASNRRWTHVDQQIDYPGDKGFNRVESLQNADIQWKPQS